MLELGRNPIPDLIPSDGFHFSGIQLVNTTRNLFIPRCFNALVYRGVEAVDQRTRQLRALLVGERKSLLQQLGSLLSHIRIITSGNGARPTTTFFVRPSTAEPIPNPATLRSARQQVLPRSIFPALGEFECS